MNISVFKVEEVKSFENIPEAEELEVCEIITASKLCFGLV